MDLTLKCLLEKTDIKKPEGNSLMAKAKTLKILTVTNLSVQKSPMTNIFKEKSGLEKSRQ